MAPEVKVGTILDGRFRITTLINKGSLSSVFEAVDGQTGRPVAIKAPFPGSERDPLYLWRFEREEKIGGALHHPSVLRIFPMEKKSQPYIVMERVEGTPLSSLLKTGVPLPVPDALRIAAQVARALEYLHEHQVVHRDIKPANVILCSDGTVRVIDLGLAKAGDGPDPGSGISRSFGTPAYMPPEQVKGKSGDHRSDIYALGAMLYEMITGDPPFRGDDPVTMMVARTLGDPPAPRLANPAISPQVEEIVLHSLERDTDKRFASTREFREELETPDSVRLTGRASRLQAPSPFRLFLQRRREVVWAALALLGYFGAILFVALKWGKRP
jgi:serine/threonine-protein kinase